MQGGMYIGMVAATARLDQLDELSDGLANVETPGYRARQTAFEAVLDDATHPERVRSRAVSLGVDGRAGRVEVTGEPLDVALPSGLWLAVERAGGEIAYTRNGRLERDTSGQLLAVGLPVLDPHGRPIHVRPDRPAEIDDRGQIRVEGRVVAQLGTHRLSHVRGRVSSSLFQGEAEAESPHEPFRTGALERGSASAVDAAVGLVRVQRAFDHAMQAIETHHRLDETAAEIGRLR